MRRGCTVLALAAAAAYSCGGRSALDESAGLVPGATAPRLQVGLETPRGDRGLGFVALGPSGEPDVVFQKSDLVGARGCFFPGAGRSFAIVATEPDDDDYGLLGITRSLVIEGGPPAVIAPLGQLPWPADAALGMGETTICEPIPGAVFIMGESNGSNAAILATSGPPFESFDVIEPPLPPGIDPESCRVVQRVCAVDNGILWFSTSCLAGTWFGAIDPATTAFVDLAPEAPDTEQVVASTHSSGVSSSSIVAFRGRAYAGTVEGIAVFDYASRSVLEPILLGEGGFAVIVGIAGDGIGYARTQDGIVAFDALGGVSLGVVRPEAPYPCGTAILGPWLVRTEPSHHSDDPALVVFDRFTGQQVSTGLPGWKAGGILTLLGEGL